MTDSMGITNLVRAPKEIEKVAGGIRYNNNSLRLSDLYPTTSTPTSIYNKSSNNPKHDKIATMQFKTLLTLSLASLASFAMASEEAAMDGPAVKAFISTISGQISSVDKIIAGLTDANVAAQAPILMTNMNTLNEAMLSGATKIKASKALGIFELSGLATSAMPLVPSLMGLLNDVIAKRPVMVKANQVDALAVALKKEQTGLLALGEALGGQVPASIASQIPKFAGGATVPPGLANVDVNKFVDMVFDVGIALFKGQDAKIEVTGSTIWPMAKGAKTAKRGVEFSA